MFMSHFLSTLASPKLYIDPNSSSILFQIILATLLGAGVVLRTQWSKIKSLFKGRDAVEDDSDDEE